MINYMKLDEFENTLTPSFTHAGLLFLHKNVQFNLYSS